MLTSPQFDAVSSEEAPPAAVADKPRICIVAHNACGAIRGGGSGHIGGVERQTSMLARWLAARGYAVSFLNWDEGQTEGEIIDGVRLFKICTRTAGLPHFRLLHPRTTNLFRALKKADADVYYHNCAEHYTGLVALFCRLHKRKFVYSTAHDNGCDPKLPTLKKRYERFLYKYGVKHADRVIVQTEHQRHLLKNGFGVDSCVLPMPCPGPSAEQYVQPTAPARPLVVWVGRAAAIKRMEVLLDISELTPEINYEIAAANNHTTPYSQALVERAKRLPNVKWLGPVSRDQMPALYQRATCLCCTSLDEGFPNTFLEAWSHGRPLVTSFDPDHLTERHSLGRRCNTPAEFAAAIRELAASPALWLGLSRNARRYYEQNHGVDAAQSRFEQVFLSLSTYEKNRFG